MWRVPGFRLGNFFTKRKTNHPYSLRNTARHGGTVSQFGAAKIRRLGFARTALDESFRLPAEVADFLHRHVYAHDGIAFHSQNRQRLPAVELADGWLRHALAPEHPIILIEHNDDSSQQANVCEAVVIEALVQAACTHLRLDATTGLGIVVPHRAQKALLHARMPHLAGAADTVERFQGGERDLIIVSATVSESGLRAERIGKTNGIFAPPPRQHTPSPTRWRTRPTHGPAPRLFPRAQGSTAAPPERAGPRAGAAQHGYSGAGQAP